MQYVKRNIIYVKYQIINLMMLSIFGRAHVCICKSSFNKYIIVFTLKRNKIHLNLIIKYRNIKQKLPGHTHTRAQ